LCNTDEFTPEELQNLTKAQTESFNSGLAERNPQLYYQKYGKDGFVLDPKKGYFRVKEKLKVEAEI